MSPYSDILVISSDEGFEFTKAMSLADGGVDTRFWCDQPWLYSQVIGWLFRNFGYSPALPRMITTLLVVLMGLTLGARIDRRWRIAWGAGVALLCLLGPSGVTLSCAFLLEVPAWALAMLAFSVPGLWGPRRRGMAAVLSGVLAACAVHTKASAVVVLPACLVELVVQEYRVVGAIGEGGWRAASFQNVLRRCLVWCLSGTAVFLLAMCMAPYWDWTRVVGTHTQTLATLSSEGTRYRLDSAALLEHLDKLLLSAVAIILAMRKRLLAEISGSVVLLASVVTAHSAVRPWWFYYHWHWNVALSLLSLQGLKLLWINVPATGKAEAEADWRSPFAAATTLFCGLLWTSVLVFGLERMYADCSGILSRERIQESPMLAQILSYRDRTTWLFTPSRIYSFHARIPIPPEVRWLSRKRFWSGQVSTPMIIETVEHYQPELILLSHAEVRMPAWTAVLSSGYRRAFVDAVNQLWVHRKVAESIIETNGNRTEVIEGTTRGGHIHATDPDRRPGSLAESTAVLKSELPSPYALAGGALWR